MKKVEDYIRSIPDFPEEGIIFRDVTSILQEADGLHLAIDDGICRQYDDRRILAAVLLHALHIRKSLDTVQFRHHMIQKDDIIMALFDHFQTGKAIVHLVDLDLCMLEQFAKDLAVHGIVIHKENMHIWRQKSKMLLFAVVCILFILDLKMPDRGPIFDTLF